MTGPNRSPAVMQKRYEPLGEVDYFPTPYWATRSLCQWLLAEGNVLTDRKVWEPAAGGGHMARVLAEYFAEVHCSDAVDYGQGYPMHDIRDTLSTAPLPGGMPVHWVITNPPFNLAAEFAERCPEWAEQGVALLCRTAFAEGRGRHDSLFSTRPPTEILQFVDRVTMVKGKLADLKTASAMCFAWFVWRREAEAERATRFHWLPYRKKDWSAEPETPARGGLNHED